MALIQSATETGMKVAGQHFLDVETSLRSIRSNLMTEVNSVEWKGSAAGAFQSAMLRWDEAFGRICSHLETMAQNLGVGAADYATAEHQNTNDSAFFKSA